MKSIKVFAPASISNVGPGFDIMGFAIHEPGDEVELKLNNAKRLRIIKITGDSGMLPKTINRNTVTVAIQSLLAAKKITIGIDVIIRKKMGIGSGLGSSAASAVAGVYAVNKLLELKMAKSELLIHALEGEKIASGDLHGDNIAPCLFGGFVLIRGYNPIDIVKIDYPKNLYCVVVYPDIVINTRAARKILSKTLPVKKAIAQAGNSAGLIVGLMKRDFDLLGRSMIDNIAEQKRSKLIGCYDDIRNAAFANGAINCNISGSGPSMFSFASSKIKAEQIGKSMMNVLKKNRIKGKLYISKINANGPKVIR